jgi:hypothetical protein
VIAHLRDDGAVLRCDVTMAGAGHDVVELRAFDQAPLAEDAGAAAARGEEIGDGGQVAPQDSAARGDRRRAIAERADAQQLAARGRAHRRGVEIGEAHSLTMEAVHAGRLEHGVAVTGEAARSPDRR